MLDKHKLQIVAVHERSGLSQRTGKPYTKRHAQCVLHQRTADGDLVSVATIFLPDSFKDYGPGEYLAAFTFIRSRRGDLVTRLHSLQPYDVTPKPSSRASTA